MNLTQTLVLQSLLNAAGRCFDRPLCRRLPADLLVLAVVDLGGVVGEVADLQSEGLVDVVRLHDALHDQLVADGAVVGRQTDINVR